jgi:hypothetical protein
VSLFPCPECGHSCSIKAISCPSCALPFDRIPQPPIPNSETTSTSGPVAGSNTKSVAPIRAAPSREFWKPILKGFLAVALLLAFWFVSFLFNRSNRNVLTDHDYSRLSEDNPYLSKDDIVILGNEIIKRGLNIEQGNTFTLATFKRGIELLSPDEQEEIARIREQMFSKFSTEESSKVDAIYSKAESGQVTTKEEAEYIGQVGKKAVNNLPESTKLRYRLLMGKALKAGLNMK